MEINVIKRKKNINNNLHCYNNFIVIYNKQVTRNYNISSLGAGLTLLILNTGNLENRETIEPVQRGELTLDVRIWRL